MNDCFIVAGWSLERKLQKHSIIYGASHIFIFEIKFWIFNFERESKGEWYICKNRIWSDE